MKTSECKTRLFQFSWKLPSYNLSIHTATLLYNGPYQYYILCKKHSGNSSSRLISVMVISSSYISKKHFSHVIKNNVDLNGVTSYYATFTHCWNFILIRYIKKSFKITNRKIVFLLFDITGNSAFETSQHLLSSTNLVHMMSRSRLKFSWETHYVGDVR